jgi:glycosyltransferase involved in cell wall biosynthesis
MDKTLIIIPVVNELENLKKIISKIFFYLSNISVLIVDDNSDDGTDTWVKSLNKKKINYIRRNRKLGIGDAHTTGILWAYQKGFSLAITMDGDLSHKPFLLRKFIKKSKSNSELILSNRYSKKKNYLKNWPIKKRIQSKIGHFIILIFFNIKYDITNGLRLYNLKKIPKKYFQKFKKFKNYEFFLASGIVLTQKFNVSQIYIEMPYRVTGDSKMNFKHLLIWIYTIFKLKIFKLKIE